MTSEICVMNRHAIVLAADSAATVSRWEGGRKEERYFKGSNKIFQISNTEPVGAMIYDSADLQRIPWEIIVKTFRDELGKTCCDTVEGYGLAFFRFIESSRKLFSEQYLEELLIENIDQTMIKYLRSLDDEETVKKAGADVAAANVAKAAELDSYILAAMTWPLRPPFDDARIDEIRTKHIDRLRTEAALDLKFFSADAPLDVDKIAELGLQAFFRRPENFLSETGIVIAGYGTDELFPSYKEYSCMGFLADHLMFEEKTELKITPKSSGFFKAFATTAMADTFTMGFGPDVFATVRSHMRTTLRAMANKIEGETGAHCANLDTFITDAVDDHSKKWTEDVYENHGKPLRRVIGSLPLDEMASLAETLVMLESLKEKVTRPSESVSGPIDVAIITRHEGFIWAKRKLYFDPNLNSRYFMRQQAQHKYAAEDADHA